MLEAEPGDVRPVVEHHEHVAAEGVQPGWYGGVLGRQPLADVRHQLGIGDVDRPAADTAVDDVRGQAQQTRQGGPQRIEVST